MRVCYLFIVVMLLFVSCSSGAGQPSGLNDSVNGVTIEKPLFDGPELHHPGWYQLDVQETENGPVAVVRVTPDGTSAFTQFDLVYDAGVLNPVEVESSDAGVLTLAPLSQKGRVPVSLASTAGNLGPVELHLKLEVSPFKQANLSAQIPSPEIHGVSIAADGLLIDGGMILPGDYNFDGRVTGQDLFPVATHFNFDAMSSWRCLDGNGDGTISGMDVFVISAYFSLTVEGYSVYAQRLDESTPSPLNSSLIPYSAPLEGECLSRFEFLDSEYNEGAFCYTARSTMSTVGFDGLTLSDPSEDVIYSSTPSDPIITSLTVNGVETGDGHYAGAFRSGSTVELRVEGVDPDGGDVWFNWSGTGDSTLVPSFGKIVQLTNTTLDRTEEVSVTITDDDGGQPETWTFSYRFGMHPVITRVNVDDRVCRDGDFIGGIDHNKSMYCRAFGYDPEGGEIEWRWSATGSVVITPNSEANCHISNAVVNEIETVTITATNEYGRSVSRSFSFCTGYTPTITRVLVDGNEVEDGGNAGSFDALSSIPLECRVLNAIGGVTWEVTGSAEIEPPYGRITNLTSWEVDSMHTVTVTTSGGDYGPYTTHSFTFETNDMNIDEMSFSVVPHPDEPEERIRLILSVSDMMVPSMGVTLDFNYDHTKLYATDTRDYYDDDDDCHAHGDGPWGEDAVTLFFPELEPANMTCSGLEPATLGGKVFYIDFKVIGGHGATTDFTFGERETCLFSNDDGMTCRMATRTFDALDVLLP